MQSCNFTRFSNGGHIHNEGRRCGLSDYPGATQDVTSAMCNGSTRDGFLLLTEPRVQERCAADVRCVGYWRRDAERHRPVAAWSEGARFPHGSWHGFRKACGDANDTKAPSPAWFPPPPWPALILSSSLERFARAEAVTRGLGFRAAWAAAPYPPANDSAAWDQLTGARPVHIRVRVQYSTCTRASYVLASMHRCVCLCTCRCAYEARPLPRAAQVYYMQVHTCLW